LRIGFAIIAKPGCLPHESDEPEKSVEDLKNPFLQGFLDETHQENARRTLRSKKYFGDGSSLARKSH
jgi:hypothetical protein